MVGLHSGFLAQFSSNVMFARTLSVALVFMALFSLFAVEVLRYKALLGRVFVPDSSQAPKARFESWFSLHENSPSFAVGRA